MYCFDNISQYLFPSKPPSKMENSKFIYPFIFNLFVGTGLPILNEEGKIITGDSEQKISISDVASTSEVCLVVIEHNYF